MDFRFINGWHVVYNIFGIKFKKKFVPQHYDVLNLIFTAEEGIGNRIFGLINYVNYTTPDVVNIYWDDKGWVSAKFEEIFDYKPNYDFHEFNDIEVTKNWKNIWHGTKTEITVTNPPVNLKALDDKELIYTDVSQVNFNKYSQEFHKFAPSKKVLERIGDVCLPEEFVALQVRNSKDWDLYGRNESLELYFQEIEKFPPDTQFYISAMDEEISAIFKTKYPNRIIELPDKNYKSMIDAITDLYILSYAQKAIYSYGSTFGELAFWFSDKIQKISVVGNNEGWK